MLNYVNLEGGEC